MSNSDSDDDLPKLNPSTITALREFFQERDERERALQATFAGDEAKDINLEENWQLSQFWYNEHTISIFTKAAVQCTERKARIALISCPSLYKNLIQIAGGRQVKVFEFDERFAIFGPDYVFYDYNLPQQVPEDWIGTFDLVICDPPFLSEECLTKTAQTIKLLARDKIILCTGAIMSDLAEKLLSVKKCEFLPGHKNNLANEFFCYANFNFDKYVR